MLEKGYELGEIETNEDIRNVLINDEIDFQGLREKLERGELPLRIKGKATLKDKNDNEKERAIVIAEKWIEKGYVDVTIGGIMRLLKLGYDEFRLENDRQLIEKYMEYKDLLDNELVTKLEEQDELAELKDDLEKLGYEISISEIQRIRDFGVNNRIMTTREFMEKYFGIMELEDKELEREVQEWLNENTTWCERCEIRWMNKMFRIGEIVCKDCEEEENIDEIDKRIKELKKIFESDGIIVTEGEVSRIISMGYTDGEILDKEFIEIFQENKNELEKELKKKLDKLLKEQAGIIDSEESGEKSDNEESEEDKTDESEKIGEILGPEEHEIWEENTEDFDENEFENNNENVINTEGFGLNQNSDSNNSDIENSDTKSEIFDYNLQDLFQENILLNMATVDEIRDLFRTFVRNQYGNDLGNDLGTANPNLVNNALGNINATRGLVVEFPLFGGSENEDAEEWVQRFTDAYTTNALADDNVNRFRIAKGCLVGIARDWLRTEGVNIDNWGAGNNDTSLDRRVVSKYASDEIKERWQDELENIKQGDKESVTGYVTRFRSMVKKAGGNATVPAGSQKRIFIKGLSLEYIRGVYATKPADLNEAITAARNQETGMKAVAARFSGKEIVEEKNMEEILKEEANKYKKMNPIAKELQNKEVKNDEIEELIKGFKRMEAHMMGRNGNARRPIRNNNRNNDWSKVTCYTCGKQGHTSRTCRENQRGMNRRNNQVNHLDEDYDEEYDAYNMGYDDYDEDNEYENNEHDAYEMENGEDIEENDMYPAPIRRSERNKDKVMNDERDRRRNAKWQEQEQRVQGNRKGFTQEQRQKAQETRRRNSLCQNCGQYGHFTTECKNEKVRLNRRVPNTEEFDPVKGFMNSNVPINWGQYISERPSKPQATRCNVIVKGKMIRALVDTGAGISAISNALRKELNIPIIKKSNVVLTIADGKNIASLGIAEIEIEIKEDLGIMLEVEVIDSKRKELILGTNLLKYGILDMREGMLTIELENEVYEIPIDYNGRKDVSFEESESETESNTEEQDNEINDSSEESEDEYEEMEQEELFSFVENNEMKKKNKVK
ncbi:unnamed protein product [Rhizophagus irregularis]|nr:unnamed protein product [Rhizophagus irregularis]